MLAGLFMEPLKMTQADLADRMGVSRRRVNELVNGRRGVTAETAVLLSAVFGTTPRLWIDAQTNVDLWDATHDAAFRAQVDQARPVSAQELAAASD
jgi:addiction module HigA family antidote